MSTPLTIDNIPDVIQNYLFPEYLSVREALNLRATSRQFNAHYITYLGLLNSQFAQDKCPHLYTNAEEAFIWLRNEAKLLGALSKAIHPNPGPEPIQLSDNEIFWGGQTQIFNEEIAPLPDLLEPEDRLDLALPLADFKFNRVFFKQRQNQMRHYFLQCARAIIDEIKNASEEQANEEGATLTLTLFKNDLNEKLKQLELTNPEVYSQLRTLTYLLRIVRPVFHEPDTELASRILPGLARLIDAIFQNRIALPKNVNLNLLTLDPILHLTLLFFFNHRTASFPEDTWFSQELSEFLASPYGDQKFIEPFVVQDENLGNLVIPDSPYWMMSISKLQNKPLLLLAQALQGTTISDRIQLFSQFCFNEKGFPTYSIHIDHGDAFGNNRSRGYKVFTPLMGNPRLIEWFQQFCQEQRSNESDSLTLAGKPISLSFYNLWIAPSFTFLSSYYPGKNALPALYWITMPDAVFQCFEHCAALLDDLRKQINDLLYKEFQLDSFRKEVGNAKAVEFLNEIDYVVPQFIFFLVSLFREALSKLDVHHHYEMTDPAVYLALEQTISTMSERYAEDDNVKLILARFKTLLNKKIEKTQKQQTQSEDLATQVIDQVFVTHRSTTPVGEDAFKQDAFADGVNDQERRQGLTNSL